MVRLQGLSGAVVIGAVLLGVMPGAVDAQSRPFVSISPSTTSVNPGATVVVDIGYGRALVSPPTIYQLTGSVTWNTSALTLVSAVPLGTIDFRTCAVSAGRVDFDFAESTCSTLVAFPNGPLCRLTFTATATPTTRAANVLPLSLTSCNDAPRNVICKGKDSNWQVVPKAERTCDRINGSITINQALYTSTPAPNSRIALSAPIGGSASTTLSISNQGTFGTAIDFNGQAAPISLLPDAFSLAAGATTTVQVVCAPTAPGTSEQVLTTAIANDPDRVSATYTVACTAILPPERNVTGLSLVGNDDSLSPVYDASGRFVVFESKASNLLGGSPPVADTNGSSDIFRLDTLTGEVIRVSVDDAEGAMTGESIEPSVAADGMAVVFVAPEAAAKVLRGESKAAREQRLKGGGFAVLLRNILTGTTQRIGGAVLEGTGTDPVIAPGSGAIAFTGTNLDPAVGTVGQENVFVVPMERGLDGNLEPGEPICVSCKARDATGAPIGDANEDSGAPAISADGSIVVFETRAKNLLATTPSPCPTAASEVILRNILTGVSRRISPPPGTAPGACGAVGSSKPSIDYSGRVIAFETDQGINPGHLGGTSNVYVADMDSAQYQRISEAPDGSASSAGARQPTVSGDGRSVAFVSSAANLDASLGPTDGRAYVHARRRNAALAQRLSLSVLGNQGNADMRRPALTYNGTRVTFDSAASNLVLDDSNGVADVFLRPVPVNADALYYSSFE